MTWLLSQKRGVERGDLHGDVLADLGGVAALDGQVDDNADLAFHVDIGDGEAVSDAGEATDAHVLADGEEQLVLRILDGAVAGDPGAAHERVDVSGVLLGDDSSHALDKVVERLAVGDEVGLAVDLDHNTDTVDDGGVSHALSSHAAGLLRLRGEALFAQIHDGLFHIALALDEGLLAVHQAAAGGLAELVNNSSSDSHSDILLKIV